MSLVSACRDFPFTTCDVQGYEVITEHINTVGRDSGGRVIYEKLNDELHGSRQKYKEYVTTKTEHDFYTLALPCFWCLHNCSIIQMISMFFADV